MNHDDMLKIAHENPPPQSWWEEDVSGLSKPRVSGRGYNIAVFVVLIAFAAMLLWECYK